MVQGFRLKVSSVELKEHCAKRSFYHATQAKAKREQLPRLREAMETVKATNLNVATGVSNMGGKGNFRTIDEDEPVEKLEREIQYHDNQSLVFTFFAGHLYQDDYDLAESDLQRLQILK